MRHQNLLTEILVPILVVSIFVIMVMPIGSNDDIFYSKESIGSMHDSFNIRTCNVEKMKTKNKNYYKINDPIRINNNSDLAEVASSGSGTPADPFVISGLKISTNESDGIHISNTKEHLVIKNCIIQGDSNKSNDGIVFRNVTNGIVKHNLISSNHNGIHLSGGSGGEVDTSNCTFSNNTIVYNEYCGIVFDHLIAPHHSNNMIWFNNISGNRYGISTIMFQSNIIKFNRIKNNKKYGVILSMCVGGGMSNHMHHNNFIDNNNGKVQAADGGASINYWNTSSEGNYWSDYNSSNREKIGKQPYNITGSSNSRDFYPLLEPVDIKMSPGPIGKPTAPENLTFSLYDDQINLSWNPSSENEKTITKYKIYRGTAEENMTLIANTSSTSYMDKNVIKGQTYFYRVSAVNKAGEGTKSDKISVTISSENQNEGIPGFTISALITGFLLIYLYYGDERGR